MNTPRKAGFHGMLISALLLSQANAAPEVHPAVGVACPAQDSVGQLACSSSRLKESGFRLTWSGTIDGQNVKKWYNADTSMTVISVQDTQGQAGTVGEYSVPGQVRNGELVGTGEIPSPATLGVLQAEMGTYSVEYASAAALQNVQQDLFSRLTSKGFRLIWTRHANDDGSERTYRAWYQEGQNLTVVCVSWTAAANNGQSVLTMQGRLQSNDYVPAF